jgi:hypothetical protein
VAWELENPVPFTKGSKVKGQLGVWKMCEEVRKKFERE